MKLLYICIIFILISCTQKRVVNIKIQNYKEGLKLVSDHKLNNNELISMDSFLRDFESKQHMCVRFANSIEPTQYVTYTYNANDMVKKIPLKDHKMTMYSFDLNDLKLNNVCENTEIITISDIDFFYKIHNRMRLHGFYGFSNMKAELTCDNKKLLLVSNQEQRILGVSRFFAKDNNVLKSENTAKIVTSIIVTSFYKALLDIQSQYYKNCNR